VFEIVLGREKWTLTQTEWKRTGEKYSQLTLHAWLSENRFINPLEGDTPELRNPDLICQG
jgi:hypothetical protein